jgi:hypothetical protein
MKKQRASKVGLEDGDKSMRRIILDEIHPPGGLRKEDKDSGLTGTTRSLERRVLGLRVTEKNSG